MTRQTWQLILTEAAVWSAILGLTMLVIFWAGGSTP